MIFLLILLDVTHSAVQPPTRYDTWARHAPGAWVRLHVQSRGPAGVTQMTQVHTLVEIDRSRAVVDSISRWELRGSGGRRVIRACERAALPRGSKTGFETLDLHGRKLRCRWIETLSDDRWAKIWQSDEIPGGLVKFEARCGDSEIRMDVEDWRP
jgi:hypothetical protein